MTNSKQTSFDVFRVSADGSVDCHNMTWPRSAIAEKLKITIPEDCNRSWAAAQLHRLAVQLEMEGMAP